jgi:plasmid replication initiation protein
MSSRVWQPDTAARRMCALPGSVAVRDVQDLMAYPFFSLAKSRRTTPIDFRGGEVRVCVEGTVEHGLATIWDADVLIWATSQLVQARDGGLATSPRLAATPREILAFLRRGVSIRDYVRLKAALDRLQSTSVLTSLRQATTRRAHRFSWLNEWKECADARQSLPGYRLCIVRSGVAESLVIRTCREQHVRGTTGLPSLAFEPVDKK